MVEFDIKLGQAIELGQNMKVEEFKKLLDKFSKEEFIQYHLEDNDDTDEDDEDNGFN
ncbi:MAG: hypothetical protein ACOCUD_04215 [Bacillota bacterium]